MLLKHNLTVASDIMTACSSNEYTTPNETGHGKITPKNDKVLSEDSTGKYNTNGQHLIYMLTPHKINTFLYRIIFRPS